MLLFTINVEKENQLETYGGVIAKYSVENVHGPMAKVKKLKLVFCVGDFDLLITRNWYPGVRKVGDVWSAYHVLARVAQH